MCSVCLCHVALQACWLAFRLYETAGGGLIDVSNVCSTLKKRLGCFREKFQTEKHVPGIHKCLRLSLPFSDNLEDLCYFSDRLLTKHCTVNNKSDTGDNMK